MKDFETRECVVHTHTHDLPKLGKVQSAFSYSLKRLAVTSIQISFNLNVNMPKLIDKDGNELLNLQMSTDEHWTGKYWIDGKKIYEKIITWTGLNVGVSTINHSISNLNEFIDYEVTCSNGKDFYRFPVVYYSGGNTGTFYCTYFILNVNNIRFANNYSWANYKFKAIIRYTKK